MSNQLNAIQIAKNKAAGLPLNDYGLYPAAYCKSTGLPMYSRDNYKTVAHMYLSKSRCKKIGHPVQENETIVAFYRLMNGYTPLYDRTGLTDGWTFNIYRSPERT